VSVVSFSAISGYAIFQPLFGWLIDLNWNHQMVDNKPVYLPQDFHLALLIIPLGFIIAFIASLLIRETYCKPLVEK
jgi:MFS family permease